LVAGAKTDEIIEGVSRGCGNPGTPAYLAAGTPIRAPERYFDPCAFAIQPIGFLGTAGRNILRGPGRTTVDFSLAKDTPLGLVGENGKLEFRAEFFNILNHVNFDMPGMTAFTGAANVENPVGTAGQIIGAARAREIQLSLKLLF
jgi:hypothetical protein